MPYDAGNYMLIGISKVCLKRNSYFMNDEIFSHPNLQELFYKPILSLGLKMISLENLQPWR